MVCFCFCSRWVFRGAGGGGQSEKVGKSKSEKVEKARKVPKRRKVLERKSKSPSLATPKVGKNPKP